VKEGDILKGIGEVAREQLGLCRPVREEMLLAEDLGLDSLALLTLAVEVEDRFRICLDEVDEAAIRTVGDLVRVVAGKLKDREASADEPSGSRTFDRPAGD
jgi:acyl carrier protein